MFGAYAFGSFPFAGRLHLALGVTATRATLLTTDPQVTILKAIKR
jgi:hypothetical protein